MQNLREPANAQYNAWVGTVAADEVDMTDLTELLGVDRDTWRLVVIDVMVWGGSQDIVGYGVEFARNVPALAAEAASGRVEVTRLVEYVESPADHADTNPPTPFVTPITWATDLLSMGFKRFHMRLLSEDLPEGDYEIVETSSIVPPE